MTTVFQRKLYAFLRSLDLDISAFGLSCLENSESELRHWWNQTGNLAQNIARTSDRIALGLQGLRLDTASQREVHHLISGQGQFIRSELPEASTLQLPEFIRNQTNPQIVFEWFWRFFPEVLASSDQYTLLHPADRVLPDCPIHSYASTVSAIAGALSPEGGQIEGVQRPHILLFTFSPVQEFIKSSRKMLDFWSGSYLLHYLSAWLCRFVTQQFGSDAVITPSLWGQEIMDAFLLVDHPQFENDYKGLFGNTPIARFQNHESISLSTAGFPNFIAVLVPGYDAATQLSEALTTELRTKWYEIGEQVRQCIKDRVRHQISNERIDSLWNRIQAECQELDAEVYRHELEELRKGSCWSWRELWTSQIENTWEVFATAIPLGHPDVPLNIQRSDPDFQAWIIQQNAISQTRQPIPTSAEIKTCEVMNVGTWWGALQAHTGRLIQVAKNTRSWKVPAAPGFRSTLSGQFSAVHPRSQYHSHFREGGGLPQSSLRLFWRVMAEAFPGLFNGSEQLNAIELTKRMAWNYGGVYASLQPTSEEEVPTTQANETIDDVDYDGLIRFPNLCSIAVARFACEYPELMEQYEEQFVQAFRRARDNPEAPQFSQTQYRQLQRIMSRRSNVPQMDRLTSQDRNGVMFSAKWLAEDLDLNKTETEALRKMIASAHQACHFGEASPVDWWALVLADGDSMGSYVSGRRLKPYQNYIPDAISEQLRSQGAEWVELLTETDKRMGPATHIGLNRALLDFSNRIVPYLTEQRFCGRVIYSGGDDVMAMLPIEDVPGYLLSLRAAWCGAEDLITDPQVSFISERQGGYWRPQFGAGAADGLLPNRPLFTMGEGATMSVAIAIVHKSVPLPTVLETIWDAEKNRAKKLPRAHLGETEPFNESGLLGTQAKDGICFRVLFGSGNQLEALMKGDLLPLWWQFLQSAIDQDWSPILHRLAEELPKHGVFTREDRLFEQATTLLLSRRDRLVNAEAQSALLRWITAWERWAYYANPEHQREGTSRESSQVSETTPKHLGTQPEDLRQLLRLSAFWLDKIEQRRRWREQCDVLVRD